MEIDVAMGIKVLLKNNAVMHAEAVHLYCSLLLTRGEIILIKPQLGSNIVLVDANFHFGYLIFEANSWDIFV